MFACNVLSALSRAACSAVIASEFVFSAAVARVVSSVIAFSRAVFSAEIVVFNVAISVCIFAAPVVSFLIQSATSFKESKSSGADETIFAILLATVCSISWGIVPCCNS